nr:pyridoxal-dependent decarboxylase [Nereida sp. MMG025]
MDPEDWDAFRASLHATLDRCIDHVQDARSRPWQPVPDDFDRAIAITDSPRDVLTDLTDTILPTSTGNTHPAFFGWVHGTGQATGLAAELVAAAMNSNCGGRDHGAIRIEQEVIRWLCATAGLPQDASGVLTTGTSQATIYALSAARVAAFGAGIRETGIAGLPPLRVYVAQGAHSCMRQAMQVLGHGSDSVQTVALTNGAMDTQALAAQIDRDIAAGIHPLAIVGTAGSVNTGTYDDFRALADLAQTHGTWLHIDAAFGYWSRLAEAPWRHLSDGMELANSIALDAHKWLGVQYDCGACLMRSSAVHRATFADRAEYLTQQREGLAAGTWWPTDYGTELSRGFRALKLWTALQTHGSAKIGQVITDNCKQAALMGALVDASPHLTLAAPVVSNLCVFTPKKGDAAQIAAALQISGEVVFSTTTLDGQTCLRAAIVNHRTTSDTIHAAIAAVERLIDAEV